MFPSLRIADLDKVTVAKFGGSALGVHGSSLPSVIERIRQLKEDAKIVAVFSAPIVNYSEMNVSMTDVAISKGKNYASSRRDDLIVLRSVYDDLSSNYLDSVYRQEFIDILNNFFHEVTVSLKHAAENKRFVDVFRARTLAYSGEIPMSYLMDYVLKSRGLRSGHVSIKQWPIVTDDNFEGANFSLEDSRNRISYLLDLIESNEVVTMGGFIGKTLDGLETTYERGGSDRTAADIAILLNDKYDVSLDFEKDGAVQSADPKVVRNKPHYISHLSYNEAKLAGMFGMKILDPVAIRDIDDNGLDIPIKVTDMSNPACFTIIKRALPNDGDDNLIKIVTGKKNCAIVRMDSISASHLLAMLEKVKEYHEFVKLSPYKVDDLEISRILFLDAEFIRKNEKYFKAYSSKVDIIYQRGVVTMIGDNMWKSPRIASLASSTVGEHGINILNLDAQEETSRILIVVEDSGNSVNSAISAIHSQRPKFHAN
jgi:aspartate kinase